MARPRLASKAAPTGFGRRSGRIRPTAYLYSALGAGAVLSAWVALSPVPAAAKADPALTFKSRIAKPASLPSRQAEALPHHQIEALAEVIASKYRVSRRATHDYLSQAWREANRNGLDPLLLVAVMAVESSFNPVAESHAGAVGLMQVIPRFHTDKFEPALESALHPDTNIRIGAKALQEYIHRGGGLIAGLQLYNGAANDESYAYANKVLGEKARLLAAVKVVTRRV